MTMPSFFVLRCMGELARERSRRHSFTLPYTLLTPHTLRHIFFSHAAEIEAAASKLEAGGRVRGRSREAVYAAIECVVAVGTTWHAPSCTICRMSFLKSSQCSSLTVLWTPRAPRNSWNNSFLPSRALHHRW